MVRKEKQEVSYFWSDDPISDAYRYDREQEEKLEKMPECCCCGEHIQDEYLYEIEGEIWCERCIEECKKEVWDYVRND